MLNTNKKSNCILRWIGNAGWQICIDNLSILIDPDLEIGSHKLSDGLIPEAMAFDIISTADVVLVSHEHGDHFNLPTASRLVNESNCRFVLPASCINEAKEANIPPLRIITAHHHKKIDLFGEGISVTPYPAVHGHLFGSVYRHYNPADCGYLVQTASLNLFHPGDSLLLDEHFDLPKIDVLFISPTEHNTNVVQSQILIKKLNPKYIMPQHRDTYVVTDENRFWTSAYEKELYDSLDTIYKERFHILGIGDEFTI